MLDQPDPALVTRAQRGDADAFRALVQSYQGPVFGYILRMVGSREPAEDLTQEAFLRVYRSLPSYQRRSSFTTWLFQIARNLVLDEFRMQARRPACVDLEGEFALSVVDTPVEQSETIDVLLSAVRRLTVELREALLLRDVAGLSYAEIGETLEIPLSTVKWRIWQARENVQSALHAAGVAPGSPLAVAASG